MRILFMLFLTTFLVASAWAESVCEVPARLEVRGEAVLKVPADEARLSLGVRTTGKTAEAVLQQNSHSLRQVERALRESGLEAGEYSTGRFSLQPDWSPRPRGADQNWRPKIIGYTAVNSLMVKSGKLQRIGAWIEAATRAGANEIGQLMFALSDPQPHRAAAISQATANAKSDAQSLAEAAGVRLVRILNLQLEPAGQSPVQYRAESAMVRSMAADNAPPIVAPDDLRVRAGVSMAWQVAE